MSLSRIQEGGANPSLEAYNLNKDVQKRLKEAHHRLCAGARRNIKLPSRLGIERKGGGLLLRFNASSVTANMQTDDAAFEAWALMLRLWLGEKEVPHLVLDWTPPAAGHNGHYERFLYRVAQFQKLFPDWFLVADPHKPAECRALTEMRPCINVASARKGGSVRKTTSREYALELRLTESGPECESFCQRFGLEFVDRQFPVGLFCDKVSAKTPIFTGGKSAIDIVGVGKDKRFFIFELKAGDNDKAGILSELLLYTSLISEAAHTRRRITFADTAKPRERPAVDSGDVRECTGIHAVMLVEKIHPLLQHPDLLDTLNRAAEAHWTHDPEAKPVSFSMARAEEGPDGKWLVREFERAYKAEA
jgi:hypothetical protein